MKKFVLTKLKLNTSASNNGEHIEDCYDLEVINKLFDTKSDIVKYIDTLIDEDKREILEYSEEDELTFDVYDGIDKHNKYDYKLLYVYYCEEEDWTIEYRINEIEV